MFFVDLKNIIALFPAQIENNLQDKLAELISDLEAKTFLSFQNKQILNNYNYNVKIWKSLVKTSDIYANVPKWLDKNTKVSTGFKINIDQFENYLVNLY